MMTYSPNHNNPSQKTRGGGGLAPSPAIDYPLGGTFNATLSPVIFLKFLNYLPKILLHIMQKPKSEAHTPNLRKTLWLHFTSRLIYKSTSLKGKK